MKWENATVPLGRRPAVQAETARLSPAPQKGAAIAHHSRPGQVAEPEAAQPPYWPT
jgi:hypothetical protein